MNQQLHGGCQVPIAGFAVQNNHELYLRGLVGNQNGKHILRAEGKAITQNAELLGLQVANDLLKQGAKRFLTY
jgi:hydroxymethylbilane synthase